jgi:hypothetical protein
MASAMKTDTSRETIEATESHLTVPTTTMNVKAAETLEAVRTLAVAVDIAAVRPTTATAVASGVVIEVSQGIRANSSTERVDNSSSQISKEVTTINGSKQPARKQTFDSCN